MATTISCTYNSCSSYNNGWDYKWKTGTFYGKPSFGKDSYGHHRITILKITTPSFSGAVNKQLQIKIPTCRSSAAGAGTDTFYYRVSTSTPGLSEDAQTEVTLPTSYITSGTWSVYSPSQNTGYQYQTLTTVAADFQPSTTYYIWIWSDTPYAYGYANYIGYIANHSSYGGLITVSMIYEQGTVSIHNGSSWVSAIPYVHNGSSWVRAVPYVYNGSSWVVAT